MADNLQYGKPSGKSAKYLQQYFLSPYRTGYVTCKNTVLPEYFTHFGDRICEMNVRSDDIWVCSFPKTGATPTQEMVWCIANNVDLKAAGEKPLPKRFPFLESSVLYDFRELMPKIGDSTYSDFTQNSIGVAVDLESPRFIKSHLPFNLLPEQLQRNKAVKMIYVTRNPCDTCISYFHHCRSIEGFTGNFEQFCELFLEGNVPFGSFWNHIQSYWDLRNESNVLILKFEDIIKDLVSVIHKVSHFLQKSLSEDQVEKLLDHLSFEQMKGNPAVNYQNFSNFLERYGLLFDKYEPFMERGKVGEWKEVMDSEMVQRFEKWQQENLKNADQSLVEFFSYTA